MSKDFSEADISIARAYSLASEAIQVFRSHEKMDEFQFKLITDQFSSINSRFEGLNENVSYKHEELKELIEKTCIEMRAGFKSTDQKFWSLAVALITILLGICAFLVIYTLFPGHH